MKRIHGFTLIEIILSIAVIAIISVFSFPFYSKLQNKTNFSDAVNQISFAIGKARDYTENGKGNSVWGLHIDNDQKIATLFKGDNFDTRDQNFDEQITFPNVNIVGNFDNNSIVFLKDGTLSYDKSLSLSNDDGDSANITISSKGIIATN